MIRVFGLLLILSIVSGMVYAGVTLLDETLQVGRMWETPGIRPHEKPIPVRTADSIPFAGGEVVYRTADPATLVAPFALDNPGMIDSGRQGYQYYCVQCHGQSFDGMGTVGQSFAPLPGDLRSSAIQTMVPGKMFHVISYGIPNGRQPALDTTISTNERWQIIAFVKSLGERR